MYSKKNVIETVEKFLPFMKCNEWAQAFLFNYRFNAAPAAIEEANKAIDAISDEAEYAFELPAIPEVPPQSGEYFAVEFLLEGNESITVIFRPDYWEQEIICSCDFLTANLPCAERHRRGGASNRGGGRKD